MFILEVKCYLSHVIFIYKVVLSFTDSDCFVFVCASCKPARFKVPKMIPLYRIVC